MAKVKNELISDLNVSWEKTDKVDEIKKYMY